MRGEREEREGKRKRKLGLNHRRRVFRILERDISSKMEKENEKV